MISTAWRRTLGWAAFLCGGLVVCVGTAGYFLTKPAARTIGPAPADLRAESVRIAVPAGRFVAGWLVRGTPGRGAVLLLHGVRSDRRQMLARARFLHVAGHSVLLVDLPAHGESTGERITFGAREAEGAAAALAFLRQQFPTERIGAVGVSLGAAAVVLAHPAPALHALVLESMYPTIHEAVADRLAIRLGPLGRHLAPMLLWQMPRQLGVTADQLRPIDQLPALHSPVLIVSGQQDRHTPWAETERLFAAANAPKQLWAVRDAEHVDLHAHVGKAYEERILGFFAQHLTDAETAAVAAGARSP